MSKPIIIIGSGLAGYQLAKEIRRQNNKISVIIITQNAGDFYSKPMLSVALSMKKTPETLIAMNAKKMAEQYQIDIWNDAVVEEIIPQKRSISIKKLFHHLFDDSYVPIDATIHEYSSLVLCLGADASSLRFEGNAVEDILQVNDIYQYQVFYNKIMNKKNIALLGAGLVGCEFANDLSKAGYNVHIVEPARSPLASLLPKPIGDKLELALKKQGVQWYLNSAVKLIQKHDEYRITLEDGKVLKSDIVLSATGLKPRIELAKRANIQTQRGILVDQYLRTNTPHIYAMGDCIELCPTVSWNSGSTPLLKSGWILPYVAPIIHSAKCLAKTLAGTRTTLSLPPMVTLVKTSCYPIAICRPPFLTDATWYIEEKNGRLSGYLKSESKLHGFILTEEDTKEYSNLIKDIKNWL